MSKSLYEVLRTYRDMLAKRPHLQLNQAPRSPNVKYWRTSQTAHRDPTQRADPSEPSGGTEEDYVTVTQFPSGFVSVTRHKPCTTPYAGIRTGEIVGYRAWAVIREGLVLHSLTASYEWRPKEVVKGNVNGYEFMWGTPLGVYSYKEMERVNAECSHAMISIATGDTKFHVVDCSPVPLCGIALGSILMWGEVVEHELGYRASFARVRSIDAVCGRVDIDTLRQRYGVA